jgi:hypothetical protein
MMGCYPIDSTASFRPSGCQSTDNHVASAPHRSLQPDVVDFDPLVERDPS